MTDAEPHPDYPLEVTRDEERAGFERWLAYRIVDPDYRNCWTPVVCKVLSSSDIVVKITGFIGGVAYSHRRYGWMGREGPLPPEWCPVGNPYQTCEQAVLEAQIQASEVDGPTVVGTEAQIRRP